LKEGFFLADYSKKDLMTALKLKKENIKKVEKLVFGLNIGQMARKKQKYSMIEEDLREIINHFMKMDS